MNLIHRRIKWLSSLCAASLLVACAPATRVILLPESGRKTALEVKSATTSQVLAQPYQTVAVSQQGELELGQISPLALADRYGALLALQLPPAQHFVMYFESGGAQLTAESTAQLDEVLARANARAGGEIIVTGHTDRVGGVEANDTLSLQRASAIRELLIGRGFKAELIDAIGRGEREPLVPTEDEVSEPRNRRVDIVVR